MAVKLSLKQGEAYLGEYEFPPDNYVSLIGMNLRIWRQGDQFTRRLFMAKTITM